jgi:hypothetical protein
MMSLASMLLSRDRCLEGQPLFFNDNTTSCEGFVLDATHSSASARQKANHRGWEGLPGQLRTMEQERRDIPPDLDRHRCVTIARGPRHHADFDEPVLLVAFLISWIPHYFFRPPSLSPSNVDVVEADSHHEAAGIGVCLGRTDGRTAAQNVATATSPNHRSSSSSSHHRY